MTFWTALARVGRWHLSIPIALALLAYGCLQQATTVTVPLVDVLIPAPLLVALVAVSVGVLPLYSSFDLVERTLPRILAVRAGSLVATWTLVLVACAPALVLDDAAALVCVLLAATTVAVVVIGEYAWLVGLTLGGCSVMMNAPPRRYVDTLLAGFPLALWAAMLILAGALYWWRGPRHSQ